LPIATILCRNDGAEKNDEDYLGFRVGAGDDGWGSGRCGWVGLSCRDPGRDDDGSEGEGEAKLPRNVPEHEGLLWALEGAVEETRRSGWQNRPVDLQCCLRETSLAFL
jgi:hypothetical protein